MTTKDNQESIYTFL